MKRGLSIIELLIAVAVGSLIVAAMALFVTRGVGLSREQFEQVRITEDARVTMERMSDAIRDARSIDFDGDERALSADEWWLQQQEPYAIQVYTHFDADDQVELVRYTLEANELRFGLRDPFDAEEEEEVVVARSVRNIAAGQPLFEYEEGDDGRVNRVRITMVVDADEAQAPGAAEISTVVVPRGSNGWAQTLPEEMAVSECEDELDNDGDTFIDLDDLDCADSLDDDESV